MIEPIEYLIFCNCGKGMKLELSAKEQANRKLNRSTAQFAELFGHFHEGHGGAVTRRFSDEPAPDCDHPFRVTGDVCLNCGAADAEREGK